MMAATQSALLKISFILAGIGIAPVVTSYALGRTTFNENAFFFSAFIVGPAWICLASALFRRYGKSSLWVLVGAPFALYDSGLVVLSVWAIFTGRAFL